MNLLREATDFRPIRALRSFLTGPEPGTGVLMALGHLAALAAFWLLVFVWVVVRSLASIADLSRPRGRR